MASTDRSSAFSLNPSDRRFARLDTKRMSDDVQAVVDKLVADRTAQPTTRNGNKPIALSNDTFLKKVSDSTAARVADAESLFQLLPDTELSMQILISSILSPKDMVNTELTFTVESGADEQELVGAMLGVVEEYFDKSYKIKKILTPILQDVLFMTGSYPLLVLPENTIDDAINSPERVSIESLRGEIDTTGNLHPMGFLGPSKAPPKDTTRTALEAIYGELPTPVRNQAIESKMSLSVDGNTPLKFDTGIEVIDNFSVLKLPILQEKVRQDRIQDILSMGHTTFRHNHHNVGLEAKRDKPGRKSKESSLTNDQVETSLFKNRRYRITPAFSLVPSDMLPDKPVGHPLVMKLPSESVIPVHVPSNPDEHIGYFVLLDDWGNPIVKSHTADYFTDMTTNINSNADMVSQLTAMTRRAEKGRMTNDTETDHDIVQVYGDLVVEDLVNRLKNGIYGDGVSISRPQEVYRVMLSRALAKMKTKLLYVPADLMTYIAFDYNRYGMGASLLEKGRILASIRSIMLFANTMSMIKNSVAREQLNITLDPNDKNPSETVEFLMHEYAKTRQASYPVGASNPLDIIDFLQNAAVQVAVTGNTGYPETKFEVEDKASGKTQPNTELMNELRDQFIMSLGLSPETVVAAANAEFATTIVTQNLLLTKRVIQYQEKLTSFVEDHIQKYIMYSGYLMDALREVVRHNKSSVAKARKTKEDEKAELAPDTETPPAEDTTGKEEGDGLFPSVSDDVPQETKLDEDINQDTAAGEAGTEIPIQKAISTKQARAKKEDKEKVGKKNLSANLISEPDDNIKEKYGDDAIIINFIRSLKVALPSPDTASLEAQMKSYDLYCEALDKALKSYLDISFLDEATMGDLAGTIEPIIAVVRAYYQRQWLRQNNVLPELDNLTSVGNDDDSFDLLESQKSHIEGLMASIGDFMRFLKKKLEEKQLAGGDLNGTGTSFNTSGSDQGQGSDNGDDLGGLDGFGGSSEEGGGEAGAGTDSALGGSETGEGGQETGTQSGEETPPTEHAATGEEGGGKEGGEEESATDKAIKAIKGGGKTRKKPEGADNDEDEDENGDDII